MIGYITVAGQSRAALSAKVAALFASGEQGAIYDPSDWSTLFQDTGGSVPVTAVEQPVGLMLDARMGMTLGPNLITNGGFDDASGWTLGTGWAISGGVATHAGATAGYISKTSPMLVAGRTYKVTLDITAHVAGGQTAFVAAYYNPQVNFPNPPATGTYSFLVTPNAGGLTLPIYGGVNCSISIDNISCRLVGSQAGNHAFQATANARPTLSSRVNLIANSAFAGGLPPTSWLQGVPGFTTVNGSIDGSNVLRQTAVANRPKFNQPTFSLGTTGSLTLSVYVGTIYSGATNCINLLLWSNTPAGATVAYFIDGVAVLSSGLTPITANSRVTCVLTSGGTAGGTISAQVGAGCASGVTIDFDFSRPQVEVGTVPTRYQRTGPLRNLLAKTEEFNNVSGWATTTAVIAADVIADAFGAMTADRLTNTSIGGRTQSVAVTAQVAGAHVFSIDLKQSVNPTANLLLRNNTTGVNLIQTGMNMVTGTGGIALGNGWFRFQVTGSAISPGDQLICYIYPETASGSSVHIDRAQLEAGSVATAYERVDTAATTYDTVGFPVGLRADGADDSMATAAIDFSATNKVTVWAGFRKESDAGTAVLMELGATGSPGGFSLFAPLAAATDKIVSRITGTVSGNSEGAGFAAPVTAVVAFSGDIAGSPTIAAANALRINGRTPTSISYSGGLPGTGNFSNAALYLFRRGGTTNNFKGMFYGGIFRGAASNDAQIATGEKWNAQRAQVALAA